MNYHKRMLRLRRDLSIPIATGSRSFSIKPVLQSSSLAPLFGDLRAFHPAGVVRPAFSFRRGASRLVVPRTPYRSRLPVAVQFAVPRQVAICIRRKTRREVLHARGVAGSRVRRPRRNQWSAVKC